MRLLSCHLIISAPFAVLLYSSSGGSGKGGLACERCAPAPLGDSDWPGIKLHVCPAESVYCTALRDCLGLLLTPWTLDLSSSTSSSSHLPYFTSRQRQRSPFAPRSSLLPSPFGTLHSFQESAFTPSKSGPVLSLKTPQTPSNPIAALSVALALDPCL